MAVLVLGGRGKTAIRLAALLQEANVPFALASRTVSPSCPYQQKIFDWLDESSWTKLFQEASQPITAVYLVAPPIMNMVKPVTAFIDLARTHHVQRFVFLSSSAIEAGGPAHGQVHQYLKSLGVDYAVLRPTWFMQNLSEEHHRVTIQKENKIYSATSDGKIPFIAAEDIASVAYRCLVSERAPNTEYILLGPDALSYDQVAAILSDVLGRQIKHEKLTVSALAERFSSMGLSKDYADMLAGLDGAIAKGSEDRLNAQVREVTGHDPMHLQDFAENNKNEWV